MNEKDTNLPMDEVLGTLGKLFPAMYPTKLETLADILCISGSTWEGPLGKRVAVSTKALDDIVKQAIEYRDNINKPVFDDRPLHKRRRVEVSRRRYALEEVPEESVCWFIRADGRVGTRFRISRESIILSTPPDVRSDWLAGACRVTRAFETGELRVRPESRRLLAAAWSNLEEVVRYRHYHNL